MHDVRGPEEAAFVAHAVIPVIAEFITEKEQAPGPPLIADVKDGKTMQPGESSELEQLGGEFRDETAQTHADAGGRILQLIDFTLHDGASDRFQDDERNEGRNRELDEVVHPVTK
jgi:hypothetical protein